MSNRRLDIAPGGRWPASPACSTTDDDGRFLFRSVGPGPETLEATLGGRAASPATRPGRRPPVSAAGSVCRYSVQYSAHRDRAEAASEAERLGRKLGLPSRVVAADVPRQGRYYRVLIGIAVDTRPESSPLLAFGGLGCRIRS